MQWRALVLLWTGITIIYLVSLLQETPYPHPTLLFISSAATTSSIHKKRAPNTTLLTLSDTHVYRTSIWYEHSPSNNILRLGSHAFKNGGLGYLFQQRQELGVFLTSNTYTSTNTNTSHHQDHYKHKEVNDNTTSVWETTHDLTFAGPISLYSSPGNGGDSSTTGIQFGVLYHILDNDDLQHWVRIFYFPCTADDVAAGLEFKDVLLPGSTWISTFSLEPSAILYSRDPDYYHFRWVTLPANLTDGPHSDKADPIILTHSEHGDKTHLFDIPRDVEEYRGLLSRMYSPKPNVMQVFTLNAYKSSSSFHVKSAIAENATIIEGVNQWTGEKLLDKDYDVFTHETLEYAAMVDGIHIQHERIQLDMPTLWISRSKDAKVLVVSSIKYPLVSLVYMDNNDMNIALRQSKHSKDTSNQDNYTWFEEYVDMDDLDGDLWGLQLDSTGYFLAAWTSKNQLFIFNRRQPQHHDHQMDDHQLQQQSPTQDRDLLLDNNRLERWLLHMVITSDQGQLVDSIGTVAFMTTNNSNIILVGLKNGIIQSYNLDKAEAQKPTNFWTFIREQWHLWLPMCAVIFFFVASENQQVVRTNNNERRQ